MRLITWLQEDGTTYFSSEALSPTHLAIPDKPTAGGDWGFNRETFSWERVYEKGNDNDITIPEAEALTELSQKGDVVATVLLKTLNL